MKKEGRVCCRENDGRHKYFFKGVIGHEQKNQN